MTKAAEALPEMEARLPEGARRFATDPDHYNDVASDTCSIVFAPNAHKHEEGLTVTYVDVRSIEVRLETLQELVPWRFNLLLDEILPEDGGVRHEFGLGAARW